MQNINKFSVFVIGTVVGFITSLRYVKSKYASNYSYQPGYQHEDSNYFVLDKEFDKNLQLIIATNPTCASCKDTKTMLEQLNKHHVSYRVIFYPTTNVDIYLGSYLHIAKNSADLYAWLENNQELWQDMENIEQIFSLLRKHNIIQTIPKLTPLDYQNSLAYALLITQLLKIQATPSYTICLTLAGDVSWQDIQPIILQMRQIYINLQKVGKIV